MPCIQILFCYCVFMMMDFMSWSHVGMIPISISCLAVLRLLYLILFTLFYYGLAGMDDLPLVSTWSPPGDRRRLQRIPYNFEKIVQWCGFTGNM